MEEFDYKDKDKLVNLLKYLIKEIEEGVEVSDAYTVVGRGYTDINIVLCVGDLTEELMFL